MKLKLIVSYTVLAGYYRISDISVQWLFYKTLELVYSAVKDEIVWFDKATVKARVPASFQALFLEIRVIIERSEIECERPPTVWQRIQMYSSYKATFTLKFLVACAPSGENTFCSKLYGGWATNSVTTNHSGFLVLVEDRDVIMSDKCFPLIKADLNRSGGILVMPPMKSGERPRQASTKMHHLSEWSIRHSQWRKNHKMSCVHFATVHLWLNLCVVNIWLFQNFFLDVRNTNFFVVARGRILNFQDKKIISCIPTIPSGLAQSHGCDCLKPDKWTWFWVIKT